jgi:lysophospholipid acyltransferase
MIIMIGFCFMDSSTIMSGLSFNKLEEGGEESGEANHDRVKNLEIIKLYKSYTVSGLLTHWNMSTQAWLKYYVYVRMLPTDRSVKSSGALPAASTFIVSATWHGFYSGY